MPADEARTFLQQLQQKIAASEIEVIHRDVLIRLRSIIEEDLELDDRVERPPAPWPPQGSELDHHGRSEQ
jgi:hypothetical protein